jgi:hypothetical protein
MVIKHLNGPISRMSTLVNLVGVSSRWADIFKWRVEMSESREGNFPEVMLRTKPDESLESDGERGGKTWARESAI